LYNTIPRDNVYIDRLKEFIQNEYLLEPLYITPAIRGYYGETWRLGTTDDSYFLKLDYFPRHKEKYKNSLPVVDYLCENGIDFISKVIKTAQGELCSTFDSAILAVFEWLDGENIETDDTKTPEYQMLNKIYPLTRQGFDIPAIAFSSDMADRFYEQWNALKAVPSSEANAAVLGLLEQHNEMLSRCVSRLSHFASQCKNDVSHFYITHGDAGGNFFVSNGRNYIVDWDEVMYAPPERDAWVMCCRDWARKLFNDTLEQNGIQYELRPERLGFYCYHMFFLYLGEFLEDFIIHGDRKGIDEYFAGFIVERIRYADTIQ
jgi:Ser/Thr protein kinase RdoA (MazF antagonist)